jgi:hypothetical protein
MSVIIVIDARPENKFDGQGIIEWYTENGYLSNFLEENSDGNGVMTYNKMTHLYEIKFTPNEFWPLDLQRQIDMADIYLSNPDDDGNFPIDGYVVEAKIISINGVKVDMS